MLDDYRRSAVAHLYPWILSGQEIPEGGQSETTPVKDVIRSNRLLLDPKRYCAKYINLRREVLSRDHFSISDVLEKVDQEKLDPIESSIYQYVEIEDIRCGSHDFKELRGWQLPGRARLRANFKDVFIASVWGCAGKWFIVSEGAHKNLVVTNGCTRFRIRQAAEDLFIDLVAGLSSEVFAVQMRALATGSDGLAQVAPNDILKIVLPRVIQSDERALLYALVNDLIGGGVNFGHAVRSVISNGWPQPPQRKSHCALV